MRVTREQKEEKRGRLKQAAIDAFFRNGYAATTTKQIARAAGMTEGNIYRYYGSKRELFGSIVDPVWKKIHGLVESGDQLLMETQHLDLHVLEANIAEAADLFCRHKRETLLLFNGNRGTAYEGIKERLSKEMMRRIREIAQSIAEREGRVLAKGDIFFQLLGMFWVESFLTSIELSTRKEDMAEGIRESVAIVFAALSAAYG